MKNTRGFITVATGSDRYYELAANLYISYKKRGKGQYPFTLICDRTNEWAESFDEVITVDGFRCSTVDKLLMRNSPYDETIFLDADMLVTENIDDLWEVFSNGDDVSAFGRTLPIDSTEGWFTYEGSGDYRPQLKYMISMNGGVYYFRKTERAEKIFADALGIIADYSTIDFKYFPTPQDEPIMAMAMAINGCKPCEKKYEMLILPACEERITTDYKGNVYADGKISGVKLIHFAMPRTSGLLYNYLDAVNRNGSDWCCRKELLNMKMKYGPAELKSKTYHLAGAVLRKMGMEDTVERLKKRLSY